MTLQVTLNKLPQSLNKHPIFYFYITIKLYQYNKKPLVFHIQSTRLFTVKNPLSICTTILDYPLFMYNKIIHILNTIEPLWVTPV